MKRFEGREEKLIAVLFLFTLSFIFLLAIRKEFLLGTDSGYLIRAGQEMWNQGKILDRDCFSHTFQGQTWLNYRWAPCVLYYLAYHWFGISGSILINAAMVTAGFLLIGIMLLREKREPLLVFSALVLGALVTRSRFVIRPQVISMLIFAVQIYLTQGYADNPKSRLRLFGIFTLLVLWTNLHTEWVYGVSYFGLFCLAEGGKSLYLWLRKSPPDKDRIREMGILSSVFFLSIFFSFLTVDLINPNGWQVLAVPFQMVQNQFWNQVISELRPIYSSFPSLFFLVYAGIAGLGLVLDWKKVSLRDVLFFFFFSMLLLKFQRSLHAYILVTLPIMVRHWDSCLGITWGWVKNQIRKPQRFIAGARAGVGIGLALAMGLFFYFRVWNDSQGSFGLGFHEALSPTGVFDYVREHRLEGNMFADANMGGALMLFFYPQIKVFIDGRFNDLYDDKFIRDVYVHIFGGLSDWETLLNEYKADYVLISHPQQFHLRYNLEKSRNWKLLYQDRGGSLYGRTPDAGSKPVPGHLNK